jgi:hypothetical protein
MERDKVFEPFCGKVSSLLPVSKNEETMMANETTEATLIDTTLRAWQQGVDRATKLFGSFSEAQFEREIAPGKNRIIYLYGHLIAINDALYPTLRLGERLHPEYDALFLKAADRTVALPPVSELKAAWDEVHERLRVGLATLSPTEWTERHMLVSVEDFAKEPHRNRFAVFLSRSGHLGYHLGQVALAK